MTPSTTIWIAMPADRFEEPDRLFDSQMVWPGLSVKAESLIVRFAMINRVGGLQSRKWRQKIPAYTRSGILVEAAMAIYWASSKVLLTRVIKHLLLMQRLGDLKRYGGVGK